MKPFVLTLRAIGTEFASRLFVPVLIAVCVFFVLVSFLAAWLTTYSDAWWLLFIPIIVLISVSAAVAFVIYSLIRFVSPTQTSEQKRAVRAFNDRLQGIVELSGTPKVFILFRVIRSISAPSKDSYLSDIVRNKELVNDFRKIKDSFTRPM